MGQAVCADHCKSIRVSCLSDWRTCRYSPRDLFIYRVSTCWHLQKFGCQHQCLLDIEDDVRGCRNAWDGGRAYICDDTIGNGDLDCCVRNVTIIYSGVGNFHRVSTWLCVGIRIHSDYVGIAQEVGWENRSVFNNFSNHSRLVARSSAFDITSPYLGTGRLRSWNNCCHINSKLVRGNFLDRREESLGQRILPFEKSTVARGSEDCNVEVFN